MSDITLYQPGKNPQQFAFLDEPVKMLGCALTAHPLVTRDLEPDGVLLVREGWAPAPICLEQVPFFSQPCIHVADRRARLMFPDYGSPARAPELEVAERDREDLAVLVQQLRDQKAASDRQVLILVGQLTEFIDVAELARHYLVDSAMGRVTRDALTAQSEDARKAIRIARGGEP